MFDVAPTELLLVAVVAIVVIGPKDLPKAMRFAGHWVGRARGVARQFRQGFDDMVRESELHDLEKKWAEENARIMREFPGGGPAPTALPAPDAVADLSGDAPVLTTQPEVIDPVDQAELFGAPALVAKAPAKPRAPRKKPAAKPARKTKA